MATTPAGVTYTPVIGSTSDGGECRWYMDDTRHSDENVPLVLFLHGNSSGADSFYTTANRASMRNYWMDNGYAVAESRGGSTRNWGNTAARTAYTETVQWVESQIDVGPLIVFGSSMGGLCAYWLATQSALASRVSGLIVQNGTTDLAFKYATASTLDTQYMNIAYGLGNSTVKDEAAFAAASAGHDPMMFDPELWAGKRVLQAWSLGDTAVPPVQHGQRWVTEYGPHTHELRISESPGGGHYASTQNIADMIAFVDDIATQSPPAPPGPPAQAGVYVVKSFSIVGPGRRLRLLDPAQS